jgi:glycosyltransferase involved in cell wall biosynthesis
MRYTKLSEAEVTATRVQELTREYLNNYEIKSGGFKLPEINVTEIFASTKISHSVKPLATELLISLPVCNQEDLIFETLTCLYTNCLVPSTLIVVLDYCQDRTGPIVRNFIANVELTEHIQTVVIMETFGDIFESNSENLALSICEGKYFLSLQADIMFTDPKFIPRCMDHMKSNTKILGISSRAVLFENRRRNHRIRKKIWAFFSLLNWFLGKGLRIKLLPPFQIAADYFGDLSKPPHNRMIFLNRQLNRLYVGDVLIRGPIIWDIHKMSLLGNLNDVRYFLGGDEKEICRNGRSKFGFIVGYMPSSCYSNLWTGSSHNPQKRTKETILMLQQRTELGNKFEKELALNLKPDSNI